MKLVSHGDFCGEDVVVATFVYNASLLQQCGWPNTFTSYSLYQRILVNTFLYMMNYACRLVLHVADPV